MAIVINSTTGEIDLDASTAGTYTVTYTVQGVSSNQQLTINNLDNAAFSYSASSYAPTNADPTPTISGLTGGTFSGTTGLVIDSSTGVIDLSASTVAAHTITYNTSSSGSSVCPNTSTFAVTIAVAGIANNHSFSFDGINDYIDVGDLTSIETTQFTISMWINVTSTKNTVLFNSGLTHPNGVIFQYVGSYFYFAIGGAAVSSSSITLNTGDWYNVLLTANGTTAKLYIDGSQLGSDLTIGSGRTGIGSSAVIGKYNYSSSFNFSGKIDEVGIWNTALTSTQIQSIYDAKGTNLTKDLTTVSGSNLKYWNRMGD